MTGTIRVYSIDDNAAMTVAVRQLRYGDTEVHEWRKPKAKIGALVVDIASSQGYHIATFDLADLVRTVKQQFPEELEKMLSDELESGSDDATFAELLRLNTKIQSLTENAYVIAQGNNDHSVWDDTYSRVFSDELSVRVRTLLDTLHLSFDCYIPDTSYYEDVTYYARGLRDRIDELKPQFPAVSRD
jgi:hypothetical protein